MTYSSERMKYGMMVKMVARKEHLPLVIKYNVSEKEKSSTRFFFFFSSSSPDPSWLRPRLLSDRATTLRFRI